MEIPHPHLLFADLNLAWSLPLRRRLEERGMQVEATASARVLMSRVQEPGFDLVVLGEGLGRIDGRLLSGLIQDRSPATRIIRMLPRGSPAVGESGPAENVLCTLTRRGAVDDLARVIERVLSCAPRRTGTPRPPLVVCLDDDAGFLGALSRMLRRQGYRVLSYTVPEAALEELPLLKPDLLILDLLMPGLSGLEVLDEIRRYHASPLPVLLLSAQEGDQERVEGHGHGAAGYLPKTGPPEELLQAVGRLVAPGAVQPKVSGGRTGREQAP